MSANLGRILLVEDHADTARVFAMLLSQDGFEVTVAGTLADGMSVCENASFDLLICDVRLPDGDGIGLLEQVRRHCRDIAGIVVTGFDDAGQRSAAQDAGFLEYLIKPLTYGELRAAVDRSMPGAAPSAPAP
jgi:two-component system CheB/CheR fusion protein